MDLISVNVEFLRYLKEPRLCRLGSMVKCNFNSEEAISSKVLSSDKVIRNSHGCCQIYSPG
jgi:hypothetical protein